MAELDQIKRAHQATIDELAAARAALGAAAQKTTSRGFRSALTDGASLVRRGSRGGRVQGG